MLAASVSEASTHWALSSRCGGWPVPNDFLFNFGDELRSLPVGRSSAQPKVQTRMSDCIVACQLLADVPHTCLRSFPWGSSVAECNRRATLGCIEVLAMFGSEATLDMCVHANLSSKFSRTLPCFCCCCRSAGKRKHKRDQHSFVLAYPGKLLITSVSCLNVYAHSPSAL